MSQPTSLPSASHEALRLRAPEPAALGGGDRLAEGTASAHGGHIDGSHTQARKQPSNQVRVRVNAKGAAYVEGLRCDGVYEAHI
jgi:hypothetical protein